jgi:hypothetical protein
VALVAALEGNHEGCPYARTGTPWRAPTGTARSGCATTSAVGDRRSRCDTAILAVTGHGRDARATTGSPGPLGGPPTHSPATSIGGCSGRLNLFFDAQARIDGRGGRRAATWHGHRGCAPARVGRRQTAGSKTSRSAPLISNRHRRWGRRWWPPLRATTRVASRASACNTGTLACALLPAQPGVAVLRRRRPCHKICARRKDGGDLRHRERRRAFIGARCALSGGLFLWVGAPPPHPDTTPPAGTCRYALFRTRSCTSL